MEKLNAHLEQVGRLAVRWWNLREAYQTDSMTADELTLARCARLDEKWQAVVAAEAEMGQAITGSGAGESTEQAALLL